jgi:hypothetical protein
MKPQKDYSNIRGFCYGWDRTQEQWEKELGYAQRLNLNSARIWLRYAEYLENPEAFIAKLKNYMSIAWAKGISTMPIIFNANFFEAYALNQNDWKTIEAYVKHIVTSIKDEPGLIMWDVMNEPSYNRYIFGAKESEKEEHCKNMWNFLQHFCKYIKELDPLNAITIGHTFADDMEPTADCVDVLSFHDYSATTKKINKVYDLAEKIAGKFGKPVLNSEICCLCRGNPYDFALQVCQERKMGWYLFELIIHDHWKDVHGLFYPDGTIRDPSAIAAVMGCFRNRDPKTYIRPNANRERHAEEALETLKEAITDKVTSFSHEYANVDEILDAAERVINYLESCELVPMYEPPSLQLRHFRNQENPMLEEVKVWAHGLAVKLRDASHIW